MLYPVIGNSIFITNGETWKSQRQLLEPAFSVTRIQDSFERMNRAVDDMRARLSKIPDGGVFEVEPEMTHVTADVIFRTICSLSISQKEATETFEAFLEYQRFSYGDSVPSLINIPKYLSLRWWRGRHAATRIRNVLDPMVQSRYENFVKGEPDNNNDMLSALLNASRSETGSAMKFTYKELADQIAMLFLAGHETSASALSWATYLIAAQPEIQERMHAEAMAVMGADTPQFQHMKRLTLTRDVFRETLRLYPSVPFFTRESTRREKMRDKVIEAGALLVLSPWLSHRNETLWDKPHVFDPDRFDRPETQESVRNAYFPFSAGRRVCLGAAFALQEAVLVLAVIVRDYKLEVLKGDEPMPLARATIRTYGGIRVRLTRRDKTGVTQSA